MKIVKLTIRNFRGIKESELFLDDHTVLVGDNNTGKSTVLEAIDLVLGPERLNRYPVIDEHDFYAGDYIGEENNEISVAVIITDLTSDQETHFRNNLEFWDAENKSLLEGPPASGTDHNHVFPALRVGFRGYYDEIDDDFKAETFFAHPQNDDSTYQAFRTHDKRQCGFLFLRTLRTGSRALSLEKGSLLDIILRLEDVRPQMWEDILAQLRELPVAQNPELSISPILESIQKGIRELVPSEWASDPHMRVSDLTRTHLRKVLTFFMATGAKGSKGNDYSAPFQHQGTGTINTLVLTLLSMIAELKQNVIFAMEEPEIAIPPYTQKRIVNNITGKTAQAIFTSHSPYVLEEFRPSNILVVKREGGRLEGFNADYPPTVKPKKYKEEFKRRFCETLLARRVLIMEGTTEYVAFPEAARRLNDLNPDDYKSLEGLGVAIINAETDSQIGPFGVFYKKLGKEVFAVFDKQEPEVSKAISAIIDHPFEAPEKSFENIVINGTDIKALKRYALSLVKKGEWPKHLKSRTPDKDTEEEEIRDVLKQFFRRSKGLGTAADLLAQCKEEEMPEYITDTLWEIREIVEPFIVEEAVEEEFDDDFDEEDELG